ncbi:recombinase RecF [Gallibacterium salpingitidis]|uniref:Recombinase RecF n=1 Tax=Gallibacterium salpingitidis TaxID=505341 RepID=A0AB36E4C2_9PAST|nr:AAA family ATPase [Gallibacterium salpingitidis]OBX11554.1 recombinase RecF [Gallibacterium salpingitidis]
MLSLKNIDFKGVKGINELKLTLSDSSINVLIGTNGIGKTKALEALYTLLIFTNTFFQKYGMPGKDVVFNECLIDNEQVICINTENWRSIHQFLTNNKLSHSYPVIFLAAQNRGKIKSEDDNDNRIAPLGTADARAQNYFNHIINSMSNDFSSLNMDMPIEEWIIQRANSSTSYQDAEDNRELELISLLKILNKIDERISCDKSTLKISGDNKVSILVDGKKTKLSELSSGFASLIKIIQSIIAGYSFFTNSQQIENIEGYVLIDEIESHLHLEWQTKILPILSEVFPYTRFIITTHSSLVLSQLYNGSASRLVNKDNKIINEDIPNASNFALIDLLQEAFDIDLNQIKIKSAKAEHQEQAKKAILDLLGV